MVLYKSKARLFLASASVLTLHYKRDIPQHHLLNKFELFLKKPQKIEFDNCMDPNRDYPNHPDSPGSKLNQIVVNRNVMFNWLKSQ